MVNGNCIVGSETFLGSQSVMINGIEITNGCVVGAGSLVRKNLTQKGIYSGNPATLKIKLQ
jgi:acetyltransferase-like isoleucine patch superfamily enzyme